MDTYNTLNFPYLGFTNKLLPRKGEFYMIACSHNLALWQPGSSQRRQEGNGELTASFSERKRLLSKLWQPNAKQQNPNLSGFGGKMGASSG